MDRADSALGFGMTLYPKLRKVSAKILRTSGSSSTKSIVFMLFIFYGCISLIYLFTFALFNRPLKNTWWKYNGNYYEDKEQKNGIRRQLS
jgi:hypothetical protein